MGMTDCIFDSVERNYSPAVVTAVGYKDRRVGSWLNHLCHVRDFTKSVSSMAATRPGPAIREGLFD